MLNIKLSIAYLQHPVSGKYLTAIPLLLQSKQCLFSHTPAARLEHL